MTENVKSLFGGDVGPSDRLKAVLAYLEGRLRAMEADGVSLDGAVCVLFGTRDGAEVTKTVWDVPDEFEAGRPIRAIIALAALELSREALT